MSITNKDGLNKDCDANINTAVKVSTLSHLIAIWTRRQNRMRHGTEVSMGSIGSNDMFVRRIKYIIKTVCGWETKAVNMQSKTLASKNAEKRKNLLKKWKRIKGDWVR